MRIIYEIVDEKLKEIARKDATRLEEMYGEADKLAKEVGATPGKCYVSNGGGMKAVVALRFETQPNKKLWKYHIDCSDGDGYKPIKKFKEGKLLAKRFENLKWTPDGIIRALKWKNIMSGNRYYMFSMGYNVKKNFFSFSAPALEDKDKRYKPIDGLKELSHGEYERKLEVE